MTSDQIVLLGSMGTWMSSISKGHKNGDLGSGLDGRMVMTDDTFFDTSLYILLCSGHIMP
jgi:hypothetical protein